MSKAINLLLVEDSEDDAKLAVRSLARGGFDVRHERVQSGAEMRAALARGGWDAVICDYTLPGFNGMDALRLFKEARLDIPFLFLSGTIGEDVAVAAMREGASDYVMKNDLARLAPALRREIKEAATRAAKRRAEAELVESEARFRALTAMASDFYWETDAEHRLTGRVGGARPSPVGAFRSGAQIGKRRWEVPYLSPDEEGWRKHRAMLDARRPFRDFQLSRRGDDGTEHFFSLSGEPVFDVAGVFRGYRGVGTDITARKAADEAIRQGRRQWMQTVDSVRDPLLVHDAQGRVVRANRAYAERAGMGFAELIGRPYWECFPRRDGPLPGCSAGHRADPNVVTENEFVLPGGAVFVSRGFPATPAGPEGKLGLHLFEDITERKRLQREVEQSEARFRALMEHASDLVVVIDGRGVVRYASPSVERLGGYAPAEVVGTLFTLYMHPDDAPAALRNLGELIATPGSTHAAEFRYRRKDGTWIVLASIAKNALDDPAVQGIVLNVRDVTEHRRFEESLRQANRALRTLSAGNEALVRAVDEAGLLAEMTRILTEVGGYPMAFVAYARDDAGKSVEPMACAGIDERLLRQTPVTWAPGPRGQSVVARAIRTGEPQIERQAAESAAYAPWREFLVARGIRSTLGLPLRLAAGERPFGALGIASPADEAFDPQELKLLQELAGDLSYGIANLRSAVERREADRKLRASLEDAIGAIAATMEMRDPYTAGHQRRVAELAGAIAQELGLGADAVEGVRFGARVHDIGKIQVPAELLAKPARLSRLEFELVKGHAQAGYDIIKDIAFPWPVAAMVHQHHERLDGSGYPQGLKGDAIVLEARILAVADVVEAMASHRPYRPGLGIDKALAEIERGKGTLYDTAAADACLRLFREKGYVIPD